MKNIANYVTWNVEVDRDVAHELGVLQCSPTPHKMRQPSLERLVGMEICAGEVAVVTQHQARAPS